MARGARRSSCQAPCGRPAAESSKQETAPRKGRFLGFGATSAVAVLRPAELAHRAVGIDRIRADRHATLRRVNDTPTATRAVEAQRRKGFGHRGFRTARWPLAGAR